MAKIIVIPIILILNLVVHGVLSEEGAVSIEVDNSPNCKEDFLENLMVKRVVNGKELQAAKINSSELDVETSLEAVSGELDILCQGDIVARKLVYLKLANVNLQELQKNIFESTPELMEVDLRFNKLTKIEEGVFSGTNLVVINLERNKIKTIEENAFDDMPQLSSVDLDQNEIVELNPNWFTNSPLVRYMTLNFNRIKRIPPNAFQYLNEYDDLRVYLIYNEIEVIEPNAFTNFKMYGSFILDHNLMQNLTMDIFPMTNHTFKMSLYGNKLTCLPDSILHNLASSCSLLDLRDNPFDSKCLDELKSYKEESENYMTFLIDG